ncbi:MAG TPA: hypothetical protein VEJ84_03000 [Acidimicrobiales bacterium]|nr:hypothetical protein [Acidimicrobiales bacterium]
MSEPQKLPPSHTLPPTAVTNIEEAHRLLQPVYSCLRRAERAAYGDEPPRADEDNIRRVMAQLDAAKEQMERLLEPWK